MKPNRQDYLNALLDWHQRYFDEGRFHIELDHEQSEYLSWAAFELDRVFGEEDSPPKSIHDLTDEQVIEITNLTTAYTSEVVGVTREDSEIVVTYNIPNWLDFRVNILDNLDIVCDNDECRWPKIDGLL